MSQPKTSSTVTGATVAAPTLKTKVFPAAYPNPVIIDSKLQAALDAAIAKGPGSSWVVPVAIVSLKGASGTHGVATFRGAEEHFSASFLKVGAMYAAFELRKVLRGIAAELGTGATATGLLTDAARYIDPQILAQVAKIPALSGVKNVNALPQYASAFEAVALPAGGFTVKFTAAYAHHMNQMISVSNNGSAAAVIHGVGYGYLNGTLTRGGFFDPATNTGIWLAGDFMGSYPYFRINSVNDKMVAQATTVIDMARLYALMNDGLLVDAQSSTAMMALLASAVAVPEVFIDRASPPLHFTVTQTKVGLAPLKSGVAVSSEGSILQHDSGPLFVAVWQNFAEATFNSIGHVVRDTLDAYLKP